MNWLDAVLLGALGFATWRAYMNGFIRELVGLCSTFLAIPIAGIFYDDMYPKVHPIVDNDDLARLVSFLAIMGGVIVAGLVASHVLKRVVAALNLGAADHIAGGAVGFVKVAMMELAVLLALVVFPKPNLQDDIHQSKVAGTMLDTAPVLLSFLPNYFDKQLDSFLGNIQTATGSGNQILPKTTTPATR